MSGSGKWSHVDQTIIIRSRLMYRCMRLIRYSLVNVSSGCLNDSDEQLVIFRNSDGKV